ncbi:MAG: Uma2 family endonuclease [Bacteroidetes bacterium]|nr:Uma2 family endonuclease [Bacteroidota bacterium]
MMPTRFRTPRPFSVSEYYAMVPAGILRPDDRVELIRGQILNLRPISPRHAHRVTCLGHLLFPRVDLKAIVSVHNPVRLDTYSEPVPDLKLLVRNEIYAERHPHPDEVLLVIEVADTTLDFDRRIKIPLYAEAGIREYWIVNLAEESLEVYRQPGPDGYAETMTLQRGDEVEILALPAAGVFSVEEILGP